MNIWTISAIIFSPMETTKTVVETLTKYLPMPTRIVDITLVNVKHLVCSFSEGSLIICAVPVYGGRLPTNAVEKIKKMRGHKTPVILIVTYGNRAYDDALLELKNLLEERGFLPIAAAAFVTEHSMMHSVATGRPDLEDNKAIALLATKCWDKLKNCDADNLSNLIITVPGNTPYVPYTDVPLKPQVSESCIACGACAVNCLMNAIDIEDPGKTNYDLCISCMRCMEVCPMHARKLDEHMLSVAEQAFAEKYSIRKEPEIFI